MLERQNPRPYPGEGLPLADPILHDDAPGLVDVRREIRTKSSAQLGRDLSAIREASPCCWPPGFCSALECRLALIRAELEAREWRL